MNIVLDGTSYEIAHSFSSTRAIINYEGLYVFVDQASDGTWELSGLPAREHEKPILNALVAPMNDKTDVKVIKT